MKKYLYFVGIDVSKLKLDITICKENELHQSYHFIIANDKKGLKELLLYFKKQGINSRDVLFSFEDTGVYSMPLCCFLSDQELDYWMIPAIELKRSKSTQQQLAERIGISHSSLQNKLQGRTQFTLKEMRDIQAVFADCSLDYLFSEYGSKRSLP